MSFRFFRRIAILRGLTLNLSKRGASASVGVPGFHVTSGTSGSRITLGIPGTGLFYTHDLGAYGRGAHTIRATAIHDFMLGLHVTYTNPTATAAEYAAALNRLGTLGLTDADLPPELLTMVNEARARLRDVHGYRIVITPAPAPPAPAPTSLRMPLLLLGGLLVAAGIWALLLAWQPR